MTRTTSGCWTASASACCARATPRPRGRAASGQAATGFGPDKLALGSTVICGGSAGRAYVGYHAVRAAQRVHLQPGWALRSPTTTTRTRAAFDPVRYAEYQKGDLDAVRLSRTAHVALEEHLQPLGALQRTAGHRHPQHERPPLRRGPLGAHLREGDARPGQGRGLHRHQPRRDAHPGARLQQPPAPGVVQDVENGTAARRRWPATRTRWASRQNGDVLIGNDWSLGVVTPSRRWRTGTTWSRALNPEKLNSYLPRAQRRGGDGLLARHPADEGRAATTWPARTTACGSCTIRDRIGGARREGAGPAHGPLLSLAATDDGSLFIGTAGGGLWRLDAQQAAHPGAGRGGQHREGAVLRPDGEARRCSTCSPTRGSP